MQDLSFAMSGVTFYESQVKAVQRYLTKLNPGIHRLFHHVCYSGLSVGNADMWFIKSPQLRNILSTMMEKSFE